MFCLLLNFPLNWLRRPSVQSNTKFMGPFFTTQFTKNHLEDLLVSLSVLSILVVIFSKLFKGNSSTSR
jgi:hypothetical protein